MSKARVRAIARIALIAAVVGCEGTRSVAPRATAIPFPARMDIAGGDQQSARVGVQLPQPLVVTVRDSAGAPIAGQVVNFRVVSGNGSVFAGAAITNALGRAAERWTLGTVVAEAQRLEARAVDPNTGDAVTFATFAATATAGDAAALVRLSPDSQLAIVGTNIAIAPAVRVLDRYGNGIAGTPVLFRVTAGAGTLSDSVVISDSAGVARVSRWTLGGATGTNTVRASSMGLSDVLFTASATPRPSSPTLSLSAKSLLFVATAGTAPTAEQSVQITNAGAGTLSGLTGAIFYSNGQPTGWLEGYFTATTAPAGANFRVLPGTLTPGLYSASVDIRVTGATNTPQTIQITFLVTPPSGPNADPCTLVDGASVIANDGTFLGTLTNKYDANSVLNTYGTYGFSYSSKSIWNEYGSYGGTYANLSPFNPYSTNPPQLVLRGSAIAYLTVNTLLSPRFDPRYLSSCSFR